MSINHIAHPGPGYWDWRCRICDEPVNQHISTWVCIWRKLRRR